MHVTAIPRLAPWMLVALLLPAPLPVFAQQPAPEAQVFETDQLMDDLQLLTAAELPRLQARAEMGDARSQVLLGLAHEFGSAGLSAQPREALSWFLKAAAQGIPWAEAWAADFYLNGSAGLERDPAKALELYKSAAGRGDTRAAFFVGQMNFHGEGIPTNHREAAVWFRRAGPEDSDLVARMLDLAEAGCDASFCISLRQILGSMTAGSPGRLVDIWNDTAREWDAALSLPGSERCGLTSSDRTNVGNVQNYFCDSAQIDDEARGVAMARQLADEVEKALPAGYTRTDRPEGKPGPSTFFARSGYPPVRVTFNLTPGSAQHRVTLLIGS
jgi:hypothetical protein